MLMDVDQLREALRKSRKVVAEAKYVLYCFEVKLENAVHELDMIKRKTKSYLSGLMIGGLTEPYEFLEY